jgi:hypothetical protein
MAMFMVYIGITKVHFSFHIGFLFGFINHPNKRVRWILCISPTHNVCGIPFQNYCLSKFQFTTYLWSML